MSPSLLQNGDFSRGLYQWTGSGSINRSLGYPRVNCAELGAGESLSQAIGISGEILYTLHYFYRLTTGATLTVAYGDVSQAHTGNPVDVWREGVLVFSVENQGGNEEVAMWATGGTAYVDSIALIGGGLAMSRSEIASQVATRISDFATDAGLVATPNSDGPEGDYSAAIDEALRAIGAMNRWGDIDVTLLSPTQVNNVIEGARAAMLQRLRARYALDVDVTLGPRSESRSQIAESLDEMLAGASSDRRPKIARLYHGEWRK